MARFVHRVTDSLPDAALQVLLSGFESKKPYSAIARDLSAIGFEVPERTIARRGLEWRAERRRKEALQALGRTELSVAWTLDELVTIIDGLDLDAGFQLRARRRVGKAVSEFLAGPDARQARALQAELLRFRLQSLVGLRGA